MALFRLSVGRVTGLATSALLTVALVPAAAAFASDHPKPAPNAQQATASVKQTTGCQAALAALKTLEGQDRTEDQAGHRTQPRKPDAGDQDKTENQAEKAQMDAAHTAVRQACEPQPTAACLTARNAQKALEALDRTEDQVEHQARKPDAGDQDKTEDQAEKAQMDAAHSAMRQACEPQPTAACLTARKAQKALEAQDRTEDQAEHQTQPRKPDAGDQDATEDQAEKAQMDADHSAMRQACEPHR